MNRAAAKTLRAYQQDDLAAAREVDKWVKYAVADFSGDSSALKNADVQEDRKQEILLKLSDGRANDPRKIGDVQKWIREVTRNTCYDWLRSTRLERDQLSRTADVNELGQQDQDLSAVDGALSQGERYSQQKERLTRQLDKSLDYIDLVYQLQMGYRKDTKRYERAIAPFVDARRKVLEVREYVSRLIESKKVPLNATERTRIFGPLDLAARDTTRALDEVLRSVASSLSFSAKDPDWPLDFNEFVGPELVHMRLRPATLIFRVWGKILKKAAGSSRYTDHKLMCKHYDELRHRYRGTKREYLFREDFRPENLRIEAYKKSETKAFYDRLADWIYKKAFVERLSLEEALEEEFSHVPVYRNRGLLVLPLSD